MSAWSDGYVSEISYTYGYYSELNPNRLLLPFLMQGLAVPKIHNACELGFGQGVSVNAHAAASNCVWWGTDFNPAHVSFAQELAEQSGSQVHLYDQAFSEFCRRNDLPEFDYIGLHGIWSWVSQDNREILVEFIRRKLKVGGVLYISYNTLPGWAAAAPLRHLVAEHAHVMSAAGQGLVSRVTNAVDFAQQLLTLSHSYTQQVPSIGNRIKQISEQNPHYLAHEYFNRDWHPMYFAQMQHSLEPAKVSYACSANYLDDFGLCLFDNEQQQFLAKIADPSFAQTVKDFLLNTQFRRDYWVKGVRKLTQFQIEEIWQQLRFVLLTPADAVSFEIRRQQSISLLADIYQPMLDLMADHAIYDVAELKRRFVPDLMTARQLYEGLTILQAKGDVALAQPEAVIADAQPRCSALNDHIMQGNRTNDQISCLVSPVTGGAIGCDRITQLFLLAYQQGLSTVADWVDFAWSVLDSQGHHLIHNGKPLKSEAQNREELTRLAQILYDKHLIIYQTLGIILANK